ncbi:MAG: hypothetical protein HN356_08170 [Calditrichaeota bacterium]|nr:hypothetical protein [Calditrichota bacterium]
MYICAEKLSILQSSIEGNSIEEFDPIPLKQMGTIAVMTDGHTRAYAAHLSGLKQIRAYWDEDELDWEAYQICLAWCDIKGVTKVSDFENRVIPEVEYEELWIKRCQKMHEDLAINLH